MATRARNDSGHGAERARAPELCGSWRPVSTGELLELMAGKSPQAHDRRNPLPGCRGRWRQAGDQKELAMISAEDCHKLEMTGPRAIRIGIATIETRPNMR